MRRVRSNSSVLWWCLGLAISLQLSGCEGAGYFGARIGDLSQLHHKVKGQVFAVDSRTIHIRGFSYDGTAPDAFFYAGTSPQPSDSGFIIPDENGGKLPLGAYRNKDVTITLPDGKTLRDIKWLSIWCRAFAIDFGSIKIDRNLDYPRPQKIDALPTFEHGVSSDRVVVVDAQTFLIPNFNYDGQAPDGHFWVGKGSSPSPSGSLVPDENGSEEPLKRYTGKTIVITLPGDLTVFDIDHLSVWCRAFLADFGSVRIPRNLNVPPSLKMLGVAPQSPGSGYSYESPSPARPAFSYKPRATTSRPRYSPVTTARPAYKPLTTTRRPYNKPPTTTPRQNYKPTTLRPAFNPPSITTRRPFYKPPTTTRRPYKLPTTPRSPYKRPTTTRRPYKPNTPPRPQYRPFSSSSVFGGAGVISSSEEEEKSSENYRSSSFSNVFSSGGRSSRRGSSSRERHSGESSSSSRFSPVFKSAAQNHFGVSPHRFASPSKSRETEEEEEEEEERYNSSSAEFLRPSNKRFHSFPSTMSRSSPKGSSSSGSVSSISLTTGSSHSFFNIYG